MKKDVIGDVITMKKWKDKGKGKGKGKLEEK